MPSWTHEGLVQLFADRLDLTAELLGALGLTLRGPFRRVDADLTDLSPAELHADLVLRSDARPPRAVIVVIVEVQLQIDARKRWSWPAYVALLRARERCAVTLVVAAVGAGASGDGGVGCHVRGARGCGGRGARGDLH
jgi:hypothetical protein